MKPEQTSANTFQTVKDIEAHARTRMDKVLTDLQHEIANIRTGRASVGIFDTIRVDYYGTLTPLNQVANLHAPDPALVAGAGGSRRSGHPLPGRSASRARRKSEVVLVVWTGWQRS